VIRRQTGNWLASVKDGKITKPDGTSYLLDGDALSETGEVLGTCRRLLAG
jgi:hypothetical protein